MPATLSYPGVYVEELPSGVRTITGVATSITAFVGRTRKGPVSKPVVINSYADYERIFGGLWGDSTVSFAVRDFYLNGGSQAVIVRLFHPTFATDQDRIDAFTSAKKQSTDAASSVNASVAGVIPAAQPVYPDPAPDATTVLKAAQDAVTKYAAPKGVTDLDIEAVSITTSTLVKAATVAANLAMAPRDLAKAATDYVEATYAPGGTSPDAAHLAAGREIALVSRSAAETPNATQNDVLNAAVARAHDPQGLKDEAGAKATADKIYELVQADASRVANAVLDLTATDKAPASAAFQVAPISTAKFTISTLKLEAANPGAWGNGLRARVDLDVDHTLEDWTDLFNLTVQLTEGASTQREVFRNLSWVEGHYRFIGTVLASESALVRLQNGAVITGIPKYSGDKVKDKDLFNPDESTSNGVADSDEAGDGNDLDKSDYEGSRLAKTGIYALEQTDLFNLLCIPPVAHTPDGNKDVPGDVWKDAAVYCEDRRAMLIVDSLDKWKLKDDATDNDPTHDGIAGFRTNATTSKNAAIFFPAAIQPNPLKQNQKERFALCGAIAGVFARTDTQRGVWKAPAGLDATLVGVPELTVKLTDAENGELNPLGINCLRYMPASGNVIWGSRTLEGDDRRASEWKYIPVRRTALFIEESLYRGTQWVVFEPNDEPLWTQIRLNIGAFMQGLFRQGAFQGATPHDAYFVKCDKETTTQNDINNGIVNIIVGFAPLKPAEFVVIKLQQLAGQIQV